jgi:hypothetical protein
MSSSTQSIWLQKGKQYEMEFVSSHDGNRMRRLIYLSDDVENPSEDMILEFIEISSPNYDNVYVSVYNKVYLPITHFKNIVEYTPKLICNFKFETDKKYNLTHWYKQYTNMTYCSTFDHNGLTMLLFLDQVSKPHMFAKMYIENPEIYKSGFKRVA